MTVMALAPGVSIIDDRANNRFPTPLDASNQNNVFVGRIRQDISQPGKTGLEIFVCGRALQAARSPAHPQCLIILFQCTRTHRSTIDGLTGCILFQLNLTVFSHSVPVYGVYP